MSVHTTSTRRERAAPRHFTVAASRPSLVPGQGVMVACGLFLPMSRASRDHKRTTCRTCRRTAAWKKAAGLLVALVLLLSVGCVHIPVTRQQPAEPYRAAKQTRAAARVADHLAARWARRPNDHQRERALEERRKR